MERREFLKKAGVSSAALAAFPALGMVSARPAFGASEPDEFHFVTISHADTVDGVAHTLAMSGDGHVGSSDLTGNGSFVHFDGASGVPATILGSGTWTAERLISFELIGTWGALGAGILRMRILLHVQSPDKVTVPASLVVVCNLGPAGLFTGEPEGIFLNIPGAPFGKFVPLEPPVGLTVFGRA